MRGLVVAPTLLSCTLLLYSSTGIIRRHDQPDSLYLKMARSYPAPAHINLTTPQGAADGEGTLIAARWVLTAAHVAAEITPGHRMTLGSHDYSVDSVIRHPAWSDGPHDLALLRLAKPGRPRPLSIILS